MEYLNKIISGNSESSEEELKELNDAIDLCKTTSKLSPNKINELVYEALVPGITNEISINSELNQQYEHISEEYNQIDKENEESFGLIERWKYQKLTDQQYKFLKKELKTSNDTINQISNQYNVSISLLYKINQSNWEQINNKSHKKLIKLYRKDKSILLNEITTFVNGWEYTLNAKEITNHINSKLSTNYSTQFIRKIMKEDLKLSYKKVNSRPNNIDFNKLKAIRTLFDVKFAQIVDKNTLILNIDESLINRGTKNNYSWCPKGIQKEAKNVPFVGSACIIAWILSNGCWFSLITNSTINSRKFIVFLENLKQWLQKDSTFNYSNILILLDNWSIHKSKETVRKLNKMKVKTLYLSPYSPNFALVEEFFGIMKMKIRNQWANEIVKFSTKSNYDKIVKSPKSIRSESIIKIFANLYSQIKAHIIFFY